MKYAATFFSVLCLLLTVGAFAYAKFPTMVHPASVKTSRLPADVSHYPRIRPGKTVRIGGLKEIPFHINPFSIGNGLLMRPALTYSVKKPAEKPSKPLTHRDLRRLWGVPV